MRTHNICFCGEMKKKKKKIGYSSYLELYVYCVTHVVKIIFLVFVLLNEEKFWERNV